jgi:hypothetical protein
MPPSKTTHSHRRALRIQADVPHTFGPLLVPLAAILVFWGIYMIERAISLPLESDAASVLFGSFILACGLLLLSYLLRSIRLAAASQPPQTPRPAEFAMARPISRRPVSTVKTPPAPRPFHRFYVDDARISR